ncbi:aldose 1-epimerase family protein [Caproiciproducens sp. LBM24188]|nr:aldose 1-epimerase family protein [Oscillospiraceae bacterium]HHV32721.1 aldose 1-epimerase family protein [Clostridiales bacterium]
MKYTLKNKELTVMFHTLGGELDSIRDNSGMEYLWQGDPKVWPGQAPVLFPIVGSIRDKKAIVGGNKTCCMERHGVARKKEFAFVGQTEDTITFSLRADEETKARFPYDFELLIQYKLEGKNITVQYTVKNPNSEVLPFQIGGHPGFNCPLAADEKFEDYQVEFEYEETADCPTPIPSSGLMDIDKRVRMLDHQKTLALNHDLFKVDALIFDQLKSRKVALRNPKTGRGVQLSFADFKNLLVWSSNNNGNFICLEPWNGLTTGLDESDIFEEKRGITLLAPGAEKSFSYTITILN